MAMLRAVVVMFSAFGLWAVPSGIAEAAFHLWKIQEVYSNADGSVQFVELRAPDTLDGADEHLVSGHRIISSANSFRLPNSLPTSISSRNRTFLVATPGFAALPGAVTPDFTFEAANFFSTVADNIRFDSLDSFIFSMGQLPTNGVLSRVDKTPFAATSMFENQVNSPTNFAGATGSLFTPGDTNSDGIVNRADMARLAVNFGQPNGASRAQGDFNGDGLVSLADVGALQRNLTPTAPSLAIPEPPSAVLLAMGLLAAAYWRQRAR
jgi:hypothetical protein